MDFSLLLIFVCVPQIFAEKTKLTEFDELEKLTENYDRRVRPNAGGEPVKVSLSMFVLNIPAINVGKHGMEMTIEMYFRQFWEDPRLKLDKSLNMPKILGEKEIVEKIWVPDTFFVNEHRSQAKENFLRITDGEVLWSQKMQVTFSCHGEFQFFPFDYQVFSLEIESFKYTAKDIQYDWKEGNKSVLLSSELGFTDLNLVGHRQMLVLQTMGSGVYSRIWLDIQVDRNLAFYFSILFIPLMLVTLMSLISLWMPVSQRLILLLSTNLFIIGFKVWFRVSILPPVSYSVCAVEYIDMCLTITILLLIEYFVIIVLNNFNTEMPTGHMELDNINLDEESNIRIVKTNATHSGCRLFGNYLDQSRIDCISKIVIPTLFLIFQICFWIHIASLGNQVLDGLIGMQTH